MDASLCVCVYLWFDANSTSEILCVSILQCINFHSYRVVCIFGIVILVFTLLSACTTKIILSIDLQRIFYHSIYFRRILFDSIFFNRNL